MKTSVLSVYFSLNRGTYGVISEEQKPFLYSLPQKAGVREYVPAKLTAIFPSPFETDPGLPLELLLTTLDSSNTLNLTCFFPVVLLQMKFGVQGMKFDRICRCSFCCSLANL